MNEQTIHEVRQWMLKAIKAYLTAREVSFPKIHLLSPLLQLCIDLDDSFSNLADAADLLTPFATEFRYPGDVLEPEASDVAEAYQSAKYVLHVINTKISRNFSKSGGKLYFRYKFNILHGQ